MESVSSVHWVAIHSTPEARDSDQAIQAIHQWNERKRKMFRAEQIEVAWQRLVQAGWAAEIGIQGFEVLSVYSMLRYLVKRFKYSATSRVRTGTMIYDLKTNRRWKLDRGQRRG